MSVETVAMNEAEYLKFKEGMRGIIVKTVIGFIGGVVFCLFTNDWSFDFLFCLIYGVVFAGIPYAWTVLPFTALGFMGLVIKFFVSLVLGWAITPIAFLYNLVQMKRYEKKMLENKDY